MLHEKANAFIDEFIPPFFLLKIYLLLLLLFMQLTVIKIAALLDCCSTNKL